MSSPALLLLNEKMVDLTIIIPALNEAENLSFLLPKVRDVVVSMELHTEIIVVDETADDQTRQVVAENGAILICTSHARIWQGTLGRF